MTAAAVGMADRLPSLPTAAQAAAALATPRDQVRNPGRTALETAEIRTSLRLHPVQPMHGQSSKVLLQQADLLQDWMFRRSAAIIVAAFCGYQWSCTIDRVQYGMHAARIDPHWAAADWVMGAMPCHPYSSV